MLKGMCRDLLGGLQGMLGRRSKEESCPVCRGSASYLGSVDFNKSCADESGPVFPDSGKNVDYCLCRNCGYCFAPEFIGWSNEQFRLRIYNDDYRLADPDYGGAREACNSALMEKVFGKAKNKISHLDFGGGGGGLSRMLTEYGWSSTSYDPFEENSRQLPDGEKFDLITTFEVLEHVSQPRQVLESLLSVAKPNGVILFSTLIFDGSKLDEFSLDWWYVAPRNGHVGIFSDRSLNYLFALYGYKVAHIDQNLHLAYRSIPGWAEDIGLFRIKG